jgi:hypothetical protein
MARTRTEWTAIRSLRSSDDPQEVITVEVMEDGAALPKGTRLRIDKPACGTVRALVQAGDRVLAIDLEDLEEVDPVRRLYCAVCGGVTRGRQWHNRDTGYGVCLTCVEWVRSRGKTTEEEIRSYYGEKGVHYGVEASHG